MDFNGFFDAGIASFARFAPGMRVEGSTMVSAAGRFFVVTSLPILAASTSGFFFLSLFRFAGAVDDEATGWLTLALPLEANISSISDFAMSVRISASPTEIAAKSINRQHLPVQVANFKQVINLAAPLSYISDMLWVPSLASPHHIL
jgi:hypothetical protein